MKKYKKLILSVLILSVLWVTGCGSRGESSAFLDKLLSIIQEAFTPEDIELLTQYAADQGYSLEEYLTQEYEGKFTPEVSCEYLSQTIQELRLNQKMQAATPKDDAPEDWDKGKWLLKVSVPEPFLDYFEFLYEDGKMTRCDQLFSKSGDEKDAEFYSFSGEELKELPYYDMNTEQLLIALEEYGYTKHSWTKIE